MALIDAGKLAKALRNDIDDEPQGKGSAGYMQAIRDIASILESYETNKEVDAFCSGMSAYRLTRVIGEWHETD